MGEVEMRWLGVVLASTILGGCVSDAEILGTLELEGERIPLHVDGNITSIGLVDGFVLLTTSEPALDAPPAWGPGTVDIRARWLAPDGTLGEPIYLVRSLGFIGPRWVRSGGALTGAVWGSPEPAAEIPPATHRIAAWTLHPPPTGAADCVSVPPLPVSTADLTLISYFYTISSFEEGYAPAAAAGSDVMVYGVAIPDSCPAPLDAGLNRLLVVSARECAATPGWALWGELCERPADERNAHVAVGTITTLPVGDDVGLLYRTVGTDRLQLHWLVLRNGTEPIGTPVVVGRHELSTVGSGGQAPGAISGGRVVFAERQPHDGLCFFLRTMNLDGSGAADAPYQMDCVRNRRANRFGGDDPVRQQRFVDVLPLEDDALLVESDEANPVLEPPPTDWSAHVRAMVITGSGRRGTPSVDVTGGRSTSAAYFRAATEGNAIAVAYVDADGWWLQRLRFIHQ